MATVETFKENLTMNNLEAVNRFENSHCGTIEKLFWIACAMDNSELRDVVNELEDKHWRTLFPDIYKDEHFKSYADDNELMQALVDYRKFGFIAEIHVPEVYNVKFKDGKPTSWGVRGWSSFIDYAYGETREELMSCIEKVSKKHFDRQINEQSNEYPPI